MLNHLSIEFSRLISHTVKIFTDDGRIHRGIVLEVFISNVRIINDCGRLVLVEFAHITAIEAPQMYLSSKPV
jgi:hypothetical protein